MKRIFKTLKKKLKGIPSEEASPKKFFSAVYKHNLWHGKESLSGTGSEGSFATQKILLLERIINEKNIQSILDLGCGDLYWMVKVIPGLQQYHGVDVVESVIKQNTAAHGAENVHFQCLDLSAKRDQDKLAIRSCDLIICFDVLGHMLNEEIERFLHFIFYDLDARYILLTNRRDEGSELYLQRPKSRHEGINIQEHPIFKKHELAPVWKEKAEYPGDFFELYELPAR